MTLTSPTIAATAVLAVFMCVVALALPACSDDDAKLPPEISSAAVDQVQTALADAAASARAAGSKVTLTLGVAGDESWNEFCIVGPYGHPSGVFERLGVRGGSRVCDLPGFFEGWDGSVSEGEVVLCLLRDLALVGSMRLKRGVIDISGYDWVGVIHPRATVITVVAGPERQFDGLLRVVASVPTAGKR